MTLSTYDLFTPEEAEIHSRIIEIMNAIDKLESAAKKEKRTLPREIKEPYIREKKKTLQLLIDEIKKHEGTPRTVRLRSILNLKKFPDGVMPTGVTWKTLKVSRRIAEFASEESRALGLNHLDVTFDKIVVKWKSPDVLRQLVLDGFIVPILKPDGTVEQRHYRFHTASAGQLRTDKCQFLSDDAWDRIKDRLQCGLTWDSINAKGGVNVGKFLAYTSLPSSATVEWDIDLDRAIVIKDFEAPVTGMMDYITQEYKIERGIRTVSINHTDGIGMSLPGVLRKLCDSDNVMVRGNYIKGLQTTFDFVRFILEHNCSPVIEDVWGQPHNIIEENIQIIFTASQFKMWKFYDSWNQFKGFYYCCGAKFGLTNFEEPWIKDTEINYQMLQTLADFTDEELSAFIAPTHDRIQNLATNQEAMLKTLRADVNSDNPYQRALAIYPEILRDGYSKESLKAIKKRMTLDAMSGAIRCKNKRLFAIPDIYAACEFWFENIEQPKGLLEDGEVFSSLYWNEEEADILRSPHLSFEHAIRRFNHSPEVARWFTTKGIYTSCHDLISRILQFDQRSK